jgi:hypothetical protein
MPKEPIKLSIEDMQLPDFNCKEVETLYFNGLTIPADVYDTILQQDRSLLIEDLKKVLLHAVEKIDIFTAPEIDSTQGYAPWHSLFILKDQEATDALTAVLEFLQQDEDILNFYLGDGFSEFGWELLYTLAQRELPLLVELFKKLTDECDIRIEVLKTLKQVCLHQPERTMEVEGHLRTLLLYTSSVTLNEDVYIDEVAKTLLETIGALQLTSLFPEIEKLFAEDKIPYPFLMNWKIFKKEHILATSKNIPELTALKTREEIYAKCLSYFGGDDDDDDDDDEVDDDDYLFKWSQEDADEEDDDDFNVEDGEKKTRDYSNYQEVQTPFVKKEPDVGRNDPCPCGSGKKYKKCHGKT